MVGKNIRFLVATFGVSSIIAVPTPLSSTSAVGNINFSGMQTAIEASINGDEFFSGTLQTFDRISTGEYLQIDGMANNGSDCFPNGLIGQDDNGMLLSCQTRVWQTVIVGGFNVVTRYNITPGYGLAISTVSCAPNETLTGGGGACYPAEQNLGHIRSFPSKNGWITHCKGLVDVQATAEVWAICAD
ncbi:hypothetical protein BC936DRAFT_149890 [Jimgerdemannia flammicorona]|uniref:Bacterial shufflon protein N-terminal domain-containing protein n=1 Tax=Jimgerdemannia flammicorona TaxID=994334 RepID=A0A433DJX7_9FUNG|nr:hypothetical protein BC936DRAFT_149890 [Jimgerdemannia flammicorona]